MDMRIVQHQVAAREWHQRILAQKSSGMNVRQWCADQGIRENQYYYWLKVLRNDEITQSNPSEIFAELHHPAGKMMNAAANKTGICAVIRGSEFCLEIHNGADPMTLETTIKSLSTIRL